MKMYLIEFRATYYCQGWEWAWFTKLVYANSYEEAIEKVKKVHSDAKDFKNQTIF